MRSALSRSRQRIADARLGAVAAALAGLIAVAGCDASEDADVERGRSLFQTKCGTCHVLAQAGTSGTLGPNLDDAFAESRANGMDNDTIEGVVQGQISNPREIDEGAENYDQVFMPADIVTGQDAEDVATYVASVAGVPGSKPPPLGSASEIFAEKCAGCHTLEPGAAAGTGPNLADSLKGKDAKFIEKAIVDPDAQIASGFSAGVMPADFDQQIPAAKLKELVDYLLQQADGG